MTYPNDADLEVPCRIFIAHGIQCVAEVINCLGLGDKVI